MSNFNWETEEENESWEEPQQQEEEAPMRPRRRRLFLLILLLVAVGLIGGASYTIYQRVNQQIEEAVSNTETAVFTSHELVIDAATEGDRELFTNLLSGRDVEWTQGYLRLIEGNILFNRPHIGLQTTNIRAQRPAISITPDLTEATITRTVTYRQENTGESVELQHVSVYRQGAERWLLSPLDVTNAEWKIGGGYDGHYITADFREPDAEITLQIVRQLEAEIAEICGRFFDVTCPENLNYFLDFSIDPNTLYNMTVAAQSLPITAEAPSSPIRSFSLPTPTLVGLPLDETGYDLLYAGYARIIAQELLSESTRTYWAEMPELQPYSVRHHLGQFGLDFTPPLTRTAAVPPNALPQNIITLCLADDGINLAEYDPAAETITPVLSERVFAAMEPAPDDKLIALEERFTNGSNSASRVVMWSPGREDTFIVAQLPRNSVDDIQWRDHPEQRRLFIIDEDNLINGRSIESIAFNETCLTTNCLIRQEQGLPNDLFWSKSGNYTLVDDNDLGIFLGNGSGQPLIFLSPGSQPFWIDEETYGFLLTTNTTGGTIYTGELDRTPAQPLITEAELTAALPPDSSAQGLFIPYTNTNGGNSDQLLILALSLDELGNLGTAYVLLYDRPTDSLHTVIYSDQMHSFSTSPDGRYLQATIYDQLAQQQTVHLVDLAQTQETRIFPLLDTQQGVQMEWSQNGEWLMALTEEGYLHLIDRTTGRYYQHLPNGTPSCIDATWVETTVP